MKKVKGKSKRAKAKIRLKDSGFYFLLFISLCLSVFNKLQAQTGGGFQIENPTVTSGGGRNSGGNYSLDSTIGQTLAGGLLQGSRFSVQNGFWTSNAAPTAANVFIGGRVMTFDGQGIQNARVTLIGPNGETRSSLTGSFGFYRFDNISVGETYLLTIFSKRFVFANPTRIISVNEELNNLDFVAVGQ